MLGMGIILPKKGRIIPYQAENVAFRVSKLSFQVISPKSEPFYGRIRDVKDVMVIQERRRRYDAV